MPTIKQSPSLDTLAAAPPGPVLVMGAGAVGCYVGGCLQTAGVDVIFVGRPRVFRALSLHGLCLTDLDGGRKMLNSASLRFATEIPSGVVPALVLLTVKSMATSDAAVELSCLPAGTLVVSLQNGISNAAVAQRAAPNLCVVAGMVPYNIAEVAPGHFHRGTTGSLAAQADARLQAWLPWFGSALIPLTVHDNIIPIQWGKLLLNLNNPVNALSGRSLRAELLERGYRRALAGLIEEALEALKCANIQPAKVAAIAPRWLPALLSLPTPLFQLLAARMLRVDDKARSSMADDLALSRPTEIDALCGEVIRLAQQHGRSAPMNSAISMLVHRWPEHRQPMAPPALLSALGLSA